MRDHPWHISIRHANIYSILSSINIYPLLNTVLKIVPFCLNYLYMSHLICFHFNLHWKNDRRKTVAERVHFVRFKIYVHHDQIAHSKTHKTIRKTTHAEQDIYKCNIKTFLQDAKPLPWLGDQWHSLDLALAPQPLWHVTLDCTRTMVTRKWPSSVARPDSGPSRTLDAQVCLTFLFHFVEF